MKFMISILVAALCISAPAISQQEAVPSGAVVQAPTSVEALSFVAEYYNLADQLYYDSLEWAKMVENFRAEGLSAREAVHATGVIIRDEVVPRMAQRPNDNGQEDLTAPTGSSPGPGVGASLGSSSVSGARASVDMVPVYKPPYEGHSNTYANQLSIRIVGNEVLFLLRPYTPKPGYDGALDPKTADKATLTVTDPLGESTTYEMAKLSSGVLALTLPIAQFGSGYQTVQSAAWEAGAIFPDPNQVFWAQEISWLIP